MKDTLYSGRPLAFVNLGLCREQLFDPEGAEEAFVRALAMDRTNSIALLEMAQIGLMPATIPMPGSTTIPPVSGAPAVGPRAVAGDPAGAGIGQRQRREQLRAGLTNLYPDSTEFEAYKRTLTP